MTRVYLEGILIETENSQLRSESLTSFPPPKQEIPGGKLIPFQPWLLKAEGKGALSWPGRVTSDFMLLLGTLLNPVVWSWERDTPKKKSCLTGITVIFEGAENRSVVRGQCLELLVSSRHAAEESVVCVASITRLVKFRLALHTS